MNLLKAVIIIMTEFWVFSNLDNLTNLEVHFSQSFHIEYFQISLIPRMFPALNFVVGSIKLTDYVNILSYIKRWMVIL